MDRAQGIRACGLSQFYSEGPLPRRRLSFLVLPRGLPAQIRPAVASLPAALRASIWFELV